MKLVIAILEYGHDFFFLKLCQLFTYVIRFKDSQIYAFQNNCRNLSIIYIYIYITHLLTGIIITPEILLEMCQFTRITITTVEISQF